MTIAVSSLAVRAATISGVRHHGTKRGRPKRVAGYRWYDWDTGTIDRVLLAADAASGLPVTAPTDVPGWLEHIPTTLPSATPAELARIDADARRACVEAMGRPGS